MKKITSLVLALALAGIIFAKIMSAADRKRGY